MAKFIKWTFVLIVTAYVLFTWLHVKCTKSSRLAQQSQSSENVSISISQTRNYMVRVEEESFRKSWRNTFLITAIMVYIYDGTNYRFLWSKRSGKTWALLDAPITNTLFRAFKYEKNYSIKSVLTESLNTYSVI